MDEVADTGTAPFDTRTLSISEETS